MISVKRFASLILVFGMFICIEKTRATLTSSYYDGSKFYNTEEGLVGRIDFAVYDTQDPLYGDEYLDNGLEMPGQGRYIYAYQIFSSPLSGENDVSFFAVRDAEGNPIDEAFINGTSAQDDGEGGIAPSPIISEVQGQWIWTFEGGYISAGQHSWFLVFSSDRDWTAGSYEIKASGFPVPIPEPATIIVLGGGIFLLSTGKRKAK